MLARCDLFTRDAAQLSSIIILAVSGSQSLGSIVACRQTDHLCALSPHFGRCRLCNIRLDTPALIPVSLITFLAAAFYSVRGCPTSSTPRWAAEYWLPICLFLTLVSQLAHLLVLASENFG